MGGLGNSSFLLSGLSSVEIEVDLENVLTEALLTRRPARTRLKGHSSSTSDTSYNVQWDTEEKLESANYKITAQLYEINGETIKTPLTENSKISIPLDNSSARLIVNRIDTEIIPSGIRVKNLTKLNEDIEIKVKIIGD